jgi:hypothetical protein
MQWSAKMFKTFYNGIVPIIEQKYKSKLDVIFRQQVQVRILSATEAWSRN